ncbi:maleylpyruvate isomerase family mycothiol-dependent enzyme [Paractinoplanes rishiriensis]|uniref:Mycothiol-dependent maleylpyruvate isomerase metal-binding domain-containing protein n=1 Tax=Paractinoplanes rishiriensis TaxID=1050105 RepID=A0A919K2M2_9ACTN|nr:maleylpyruvate isomerase family mycothiol-dependent enzyme [Actinoplanes rishiriensis]GIE97737.1 hypothetical protein Ari01nite_52020 [Actinoplanes rishiriensis]
MDYLAILRRELDRFHGHLGADRTAPVAHCGDWTVRDLAVHLGQGNLWAATAVTERHSRYEVQPPPDDLPAWFADTSRVLMETLERDPDTEAWTFAEPRTVAFWRRRRCHETVVHRWDLEHALGLASDLDPALCADGVAEVVEMFVPRQVRLGRMEALTGAVRLTATDAGQSWQLGPGEPVTDLAGPAETVMLALWGRARWSDLDGDHEAAAPVLRGPLVP